MDDVLLLDSSFLFPIFGVGLEYRNFDLVFPKLTDRYSVKYNPVSLIEAKWFILRQARKRKGSQNLLQSYRSGLLSFQRDERFESTPLTNEKIEETADLLLEKYAIQDYFDRLLYSTAAYLGSIFLTEDNQLHEVFKKTQDDMLKPKKMIKWKDMLLIAESKK
jgi:hypothetical protein